MVENEPPRGVSEGASPGPDGDAGMPRALLLDRVPPGPAADAVAALAIAVDTISGLPSAMHQVGSADLGALVELLGDVADRAHAAMIAATAEAESRGVVRDSRAASTAQWVASHGGRLEPGEATRIATVAAASNEPDNAMLRDAVAAGHCSVRGAAVTLRELDKIMPALPSFARDEAMAYFLQVADAGSTKDLRHLARWLVATYGGDQLERDDAALERAEEMRWTDLPGGLRRFILDLGPANAARLSAAVQSLSGPQPVVDPETGEQGPDPRRAGKRRADALMELLALAQSTDTRKSHGSTTKLVVTVGLDQLAGTLGDRGVRVMSQDDSGTAFDAVPFDWSSGGDDARDVGDTRDAGDTGDTSHRSDTGHPTDAGDTSHRSDTGHPTDASACRDACPTGHPDAGDACHACDGKIGSDGEAESELVDMPVWGSGLGISINSDLLDIGAVRQLACDADVVPLVLGSRSEPLDIGREERLVKDALRTAVIARDRCCTFPGCDRPPGFSEVHHVLPWYRGGVTSLLNSALLCRRHHTIVHRDDLTAEVTAFSVRWILTSQAAA